jgi:hypothetical protein
MKCPHCNEAFSIHATKSVGPIRSRSANVDDEFAEAVRVATDAPRGGAVLTGDIAERLGMPDTVMSRRHVGHALRSLGFDRKKVRVDSVPTWVWQRSDTENG